MKKLIRLWWLLPLLYLTVLIVYVLAMLGGAGHVPHLFDPLSHVVIGFCYLIDIFAPRGSIASGPRLILFCLGINFGAYALVGALIDIATRKYRQRQNLKK